MDLELSALSGPARASGAWAAAGLLALARDEAAGRRRPRLTEPGLATWERFRGRLGPRDLLALLFEDAAVLHPVPFDPSAVDPELGLDAVPSATVAAWLAALPGLDLAEPGPDYLARQARRLGVPTRMARSELHKVQVHQRVLELPGTGGQLAHHLASEQPELSLVDTFTVACASAEELTLAAVAGLELGAAHTRYVQRVEPAALADPDHPLRRGRFDVVVGLDPDKGGLFRVPDQLALWFADAKIVLV